MKIEDGKSYLGNFEDGMDCQFGLTEEHAFFYKHEIHAIDIIPELMHLIYKTAVKEIKKYLELSRDKQVKISDSVQHTLLAPPLSTESAIAWQKESAFSKRN